MENVLILGNKVFYMPAINESSLEKRPKKSVSSDNKDYLELQRHWSQSEEDLKKEKEIFQNILGEEISKGA
ncbi:hypothetical protein [Halobacteriovorax sp. HLS]|uniref:hypothetical protein n=1 Tax=Halobacteriovorax sp. HLS TaxID=2234000 RepID=UPI000FD9A2A3|nr:hypothetical protein [Halobacteriovorax sp. HLS]